MCSGRGVDKLGGYANSVGHLANATFEHIAHPQFATHLLEVHCSALVSETRVARDYEQLPETRQSGDDLFDDAVSEIRLLRVATHVLERKHGNRGFVGER